ncbi:MAG: hypothetical protein QHC90_13205 [Shinella sp.]|nr:hypothetical protein [Shinella sp.]
MSKPIAKAGAPLKFIHGAILCRNDDCLFWPYGKTTEGYAVLNVDGKGTSASRYLCELVNGKAPSSRHQAAHSCGNGHKGCVNPLHLSWKTPKDNQADRVLHGTDQNGERNSQAVLTELQAKEILRLKGIRTQKSLAKEFGVSRTAISKVHRRVNWAWL